MTVVCLEPEAVENGPMVHRAMRGAIMGMEEGDVEEEGGGSLDVYEGVWW